jgi:acyl carrier protein
MFERIRDTNLERGCTLPREEITPQTDFYVDLGWTSLDMVGCITEFCG